MKKIFILISVAIPFFMQAQKVNPILVDSPFFENMRCAVAHMTKDGVFSCDFRGTLYPVHIYDTSIYKWFIKMVGEDSLFYYRHDFEEVFIWNGRPKNEEYGYVMDIGGGSITLPNKYTTDTLKFKKQAWRPKL